MGRRMAEQETTRTGTSTLDRFFKITERGSTVPRELRGGLVTFVTMAYIVVLNPLIIGSFSAAAVTALAAGVMTILMGPAANYPFATATGLGINSLVAVTIAPQMTWPEAMGLVVIVGVFFVVLVLFGFWFVVFWVVS